MQLQHHPRPRPHLARLDQVTLAYQTVGAGPPLVRIHGLLGSGRW